MALGVLVCLWGNGYFPSEFLTTIRKGNALESSEMVGRYAAACIEEKLCNPLADSYLFQPLSLPGSPLSPLLVLDTDSNYRKRESSWA
jgi:hypothetical protein